MSEIEELSVGCTNLLTFEEGKSKFDSLWIGYGKTQYCFAMSVAVNLIYYPMMAGLLEKGVFTPNITFICMMFGFGMVTHLGCNTLCYMIVKRHGRSIKYRSNLLMQVMLRRGMEGFA